MKKWFSSDVNNLDDLKKEYRKLCFKHHPDMGGSTEDMQAINSEYEQLLKVLINKKADSNYSEKSTFKNRDEEIDAEIRLREVLEKIEILEGLEIERIGLWLYVSGNTNSNETKAKDESGNIEDYLSPKGKKLAQRKEQMKRELELLDEQIAQEVEQAKLKVKDDLFKLLDRNKLLEISPKVWKKHMDDIKKILLG
ncbi:hypothetical protein ACRCKS_19995 [Acinetobacter baumannii]|uniref:hypothetical protein n=6 Tax=Acinetobacter baumannii TaxID=470 RepID=UPI003D6B3DEF